MGMRRIETIDANATDVFVTVRVTGTVTAVFTVDPNAEARAALAAHGFVADGRAGGRIAVAQPADPEAAADAIARAIAGAGYRVARAHLTDAGVFYEVL